MSLNVKESATALALLALAAGAWFGAVTFAAEARVFPRLVAGVMAALALIMLGRSVFMATDTQQRRFFKHFPTFLLCLGLILGYVYATSLLGYFTASAMFVPAFALLLGLKRPVVIAASTLGFLVVTHLVFVEAFDRPLPVEFFLRQ